MNIIISNSVRSPIYEQISMQIREKIIRGELKEGDMLPSMRLLAKELKISVITTKRAYEELERDGFIVTSTGRGSFVAAQNTELIKEEFLKKIEDHMREIVSLSGMCGITAEDLKQMLELIYEEG